jgi:uncharacterized hydrophobic protein (TIGR00271 family)
MIKLLRLLTFFRLGDNAEDPAVAMESIERNVVFRGTNLMILVFAIIIASVGLNVNSAAVIIGAMLISPLMGPIVGVGAGLGVMDLELVRKALKNLAFAVAASVVTSTLYFVISPLGDAHSEILARTSPTIWDVLIATAGGFAGIIATASKDRGNVVPGVAIATALMPPLCTAGFGLAHGNMAYFAGAFYLFLINSVFISLAALATVRWLNYPAKEQAEERTTKRIRSITTTVVLLTVVPSIYLAYRLVQQNTFKQRAMRFIAAECVIPENYLAAQTVDPTERSITLTYMGAGLSKEQEADLQRRLLVHDLKDVQLQVRTGLSLSEFGSADRSRNAGLEKQLNEQRALLASLAAVRDSLKENIVMREALLAEARAMDPGLSWLVLTDAPEELTKKDSVAVIVSARYGHYPDSTSLGRMDRWLNVKLNGRKYALAVSADTLPQPTSSTRRRR